MMIGDFEKAAQLCPKVFAQDAKAWEEEVFTFLKFNQLQVHTIVTCLLACS